MTIILFFSLFLVRTGHLRDFLYLDDSAAITAVVLKFDNRIFKII